MKQPGIYTVLILLCVKVSFAQSLNDTIQIEEVRVLAKKRIEEAGLKITRPDSIARVSSITTNLSELISDYSPVFIKSFGRGSQATASFRGSAATHTQVLWNGMNLNSPMRGYADLSLLPVFFTDDIYLLHGGSSMVEGSGALGGSIHLQNNPDWKSAFSISGIIQSGSFQTRNSFLKLSVGSEYFKSVTRLFYEESENDFPFYNYGIIPIRKDTLKNADYRKGGILQELYYRRYFDRFLVLRLWYQKNDRNLPQLMSFEGADREEFQKDEQFRVQYEWKKYSNTLNYHFYTGFNLNHLNYFRASPEFNYINEDLESRESSLQNHFRVFREFDEQTFATLSIDANYYEVSTNDNVNGNGYNADRLETSLMVNLHFKPSDHFAAFVLLRSENYDKEFVPLIPGAGLEWQFINDLPVLFQANVARNYHKPTLNDLYWLPGGNPDLLAEDGFTGDVSFSGNFDFGAFKFNNEITGFASLIKNWILWRPAANGAYYWEANNVKDVYARGLEYHFSAEVSWNNVRLKSGANYSFTKTTNQNATVSVDQSRGKQLIYIPKHKGNVYLSAAWKGFTAKYDLFYTGKRYTKSSNDESEFERVLNPYWLSKFTVDKKIFINKSDLILKLEVENLFNEDYQSILWRAMPGRHYNFAVQINFNQK